MAKLEDRKYDLRTLERNLRKGAITQEQYDAYLAKLDDLQPKGVPFEASFVEGILEEEQGGEEDSDEG